MAGQQLVVTGMASTALLLRVINLIAIHDLPLRSIEAEMAEDLSIRIACAARADRPVELVVERLRSLVEVSSVELR